MNNDINKLNQLYNNILGRDVDESGIKTYLPMIKKRDIKKITDSLQSSREYLKTQNPNEQMQDNVIEKFDSMKGDRKTYISQSAKTDFIDSSPYSKIFDIVLNSLKNNAESKIDIQNLKLSLINSIANNERITVFPHKEYLFNGDKFIDSLKNYNNFIYYVSFVVLCLLVKGLTGKTVATCGSQNKLRTLVKNKCANFPDLFNEMKESIFSQLSIRINGQIPTPEEIEKFTSFIKNQDSLSVIKYMQSKCEKVIEQENKQITDYLSTLPQKPRVLLHIAYLENQEPYLLQKMLDHAYNLKEHNPHLDINYYFENDRVGKESKDYTPWSRVKRVRNIMLSRTNLDDYDYLYVIDSDIVSYPYNFVSRAIGLNPEGITAPVMLIENSNVFYDWCGYQQKDRTSINSKYARDIMKKGCASRNFDLNPPYVKNDNRLVEIDCVGCTYVVPTSTFQKGYGKLQDELLKVFRMAKVNNHKIFDNIVQYEDHPSFTDHYTVCTALRSQGGKIFMDRGSVAYHADLPIYGENWH